MSWKSCITATFATMFVAAVLGCDDDDPSSPEPEPSSVTGDYDYAFEVANGGGNEVTCQGQGTITIEQDSDTTFNATTGAEGTVHCIVFDVPIDDQSGVVPLVGQIDGSAVAFQFPLLEDSELCDASGETEGDPVAGMQGTATCVLDPEALGIDADESVELTGSWEAERTDG